MDLERLLSALQLQFAQRRRDGLGQLRLGLRADRHTTGRRRAFDTRRDVDSVTDDRVRTPSLSSQQTD